MVCRRDGIGTQLGRFRPQAPWGGWVTGRWSQDRVVCLGRRIVYAWVGVSSAWVGISLFYPRRGALRTRTRRQQQARRAKRSKRTTPPTRSSRRRSTCARTSPHTARAPRGSRAAARGAPASGKRSRRNPSPQQEARPLLAWCALRALRACAARRAQRRGGRLGVLRACASLSIQVRPGAGEANEAQGPTSHITTRVRACGLTYVKSPRLATSLASLVLVRLA